MGRSGQQQAAMEQLDNVSSEAVREEALYSISWNCDDEGSHATSDVSSNQSKCRSSLSDGIWESK